MTPIILSQSSSASVLQNPSASSSRKRSRGVDGVLNLGKRQKNPNANVPILRLPSSLLVEILRLAGGNHAFVSRGFSKAQNTLSTRKHNCESLKAIWLKLFSKLPEPPVTIKPLTVANYEKLKQFYWIENIASQIRGELNRKCLKKVTVLVIGKGVQKVAGVRVRSVPPEIRKLIWLKSLKFQHTKLRELPDAIGSLQQLERLYLNDNKFTSIPKEIGDLAKLSILDLHNNQLKSLPEETRGLSKLKGLRLGNNQFESLSEAIGDLANLKELDLQNNQLQSLPDAIGGLRNLTKLDLENNRLTRLPETIGGLRKLTHLDLENNRLISLPEAIGGLSKLIRLYLNNNQLQSLSEAIGGLSNLKKLEVRNNRLTSLPKKIGGLRKLTQLDLVNNQFQSLPQAIKGDKYIVSFRPQRAPTSENFINRFPEAKSNSDMKGDRPGLLPSIYFSSDKLDWVSSLLF